MDRATRVLFEEDQLLRARLAEHHPEEAHGLGYWLYETTLVYLVFREWCSTHHVVWDWQSPADPPENVDRESTTNKTEKAGENGWKRKRLDRTVKLKNSHAAIEAKWWSSNSHQVAKR